MSEIAVPFLPADSNEYLEPAQRALFSVEQTARHDIHRLKFSRNLGTLLLFLDARRTVRQLLEPEQIKELREFGFTPVRDPHITILNFNNGRRLYQALDGRRGRLNQVKRQAKKIDWRWQPTGQVVPFRGRHSGNLKLIALIDCPGSEQLYEHLEDTLPGLEIDRGPMHITLMRRRYEVVSSSEIAIGGVAVGNALNSLDQFPGA